MVFASVTFAGVQRLKTEEQMSRVSQFMREHDHNLCKCIVNSTVVGNNVPDTQTLSIFGQTKCHKVSDTAYKRLIP